MQKYYSPLEFGKLRKIAMEKGFKHCEAGPLVRSSYHGDEQVNARKREQQGESEIVIGSNILSPFVMRKIYRMV